MSFRVKEIFRTLQGEGLRMGKAAVFCRFSDCNLSCDFCDTDFKGTDGLNGGIYPNENSLVQTIIKAFGKFEPESNDEFSVDYLQSQYVGSDYGGLMWSGMGLMGTPPKAYVILTGGEPALQITKELIQTLHNYRLDIGIETNGTLELPEGLDWITVSPKADTKLKILSGQELKLVYPQENCDPAKYEHLAFENFILMPKDEQDPVKNAANAKAALNYCLEHPRWRLGVQLHKIIGFD